MPVKTLLDIALMQGTAGVKSIVDGIGELSPEMTRIPTKTIKGTIIKAPVRTSVPKMHFRNANGGTPVSKAKYELVNVEALNISDVIEVDVQVANEHPEGSNMCMSEEIIAHGIGGMQTLAYQNIYGTDYDAKGYSGIYQQMADYQTISADPQYNDAALKTKATMDKAVADNSGTSAILLAIGEQYCYQFWGNGKTLSFSPVRQEIVAKSDNSKMNAYVSAADGKAGLAVINPRSVARIKNISSTNPLTDDLLAKAVRMLPNGAKYIIIVSRAAAQSLEEWRSKKGTYMVNGGFGGELAAGVVSKFRGADIIETVSILDDETAENVKALAAENDIKRKAIAGAIK